MLWIIDAGDDESVTYWATLSRDIGANKGNTKGRFLVLNFRTAAALRCLDRGKVFRCIGNFLTAPYRLVCGWGMGFELPPEVHVGPGLQVFHGQGIVVHPSAHIGSDVTLRHGCTLGTKTAHCDDLNAPTLGDYVEMGAGSAVIGPVRVGDHAVIGAGAVVTTDVPEYAIVVGVPARVIGDVRDLERACR